MEAAIKVLKLKSDRQGETSLKVTEVFSQKEIECLHTLNAQVSGKTIKQQNLYDQDHLAWASWIIARLAGWKGFYNKDSPPGNKTFIGGVDKFEAIMIGYNLK